MPVTASSGGVKRATMAAKQQSYEVLAKRLEALEQGGPRYLGGEQDEEEDYKPRSVGMGKRAAGSQLGGQRNGPFSGGEDYSRWLEVGEEFRSLERMFSEATRNVAASQVLPVLLDQRVDSAFETARKNTAQNVEEAMAWGMGPNEDEQLKLWGKSLAQACVGIMSEAVGKVYGPLVDMMGSDLFARWSEGGSLTEVRRMVQSSLRELQREVVKEAATHRTQMSQIQNQTQLLVGVMGQGGGSGIGARGGGAGMQPLVAGPRAARPGLAQRQQMLPPPPTWRKVGVCDDWRGYTPGFCNRGQSCKFALSHLVENQMTQAQPR